MRRRRRIMSRVHPYGKDDKEYDKYDKYDKYENYDKYDKEYDRV